MSTYNPHLMTDEERNDVCAICDAAPEPGAEWGDWTSDDVNNVYCPEHNRENPTSENYTEEN